MTNPNISSMNDVSLFIDLSTLGFNITCYLGKKCIDLFNKLKHYSLELIIPLNPNMFSIQKLNLHSHVFLNVNISNIWPCISYITGIMNNSLTYCPVPTWIFLVLDMNFGKECNDLHLKYGVLDIKDLLQCPKVSDTQYHLIMFLLYNLGLI